MSALKVASIIFHSKFGCIKENLSQTHHWIKKASQMGADVICFPEMHITGYACHKDLALSAIGIKSNTTSQLSTWAKKYQILILAGFAENTLKGELYATHGVFFPNGKMDAYRKTHLAPPEQSYFTAGNHLPVFEYKGFNFGIQLCYDAHFPEISTEMTRKEMDILFIPHASPNGTPQKKYQSWMRHLPARAFDNSIYVIAVNQCGDNGKGLFFPGVGLFMAPSGHLMDVILGDGESITLSTLTHQALDQVRKHRMRYFFPNRRMDLGLRNEN